MKRRLKTEIQNKKKFRPIDKDSEEAKEFEESLLKLAQLAKNKIKISEFTPIDRCNLLDLFVNNEKTLLKIYEACFPHRTNNFADPNQQLGVNLQSQPRNMHQKHFSMDVSKNEFNASYRQGVGFQENSKQGDNSFYGCETEPLVGIEYGKRGNTDLNLTTNDAYQDQKMPTILPNIKQRQSEEMGKARGITKPSTLGNFSGFGSTNR
jgi:hypothetical protein